MWFLIINCRIEENSEIKFYMIVILVNCWFMEEIYCVSKVIIVCVSM